MDIHESTADAKEKVSKALALFRERVLNHNRIEYEETIKLYDDKHGPVNPEDDEAVEIRIFDILEGVTTDQPDGIPEGVKLPADILVVPGVISDGKVSQYGILFTLID